MKSALSIILSLLLVASPCLAFQLNITDHADGSRSVLHNDADWLYVSSLSEFKVSVDQSVVGAKANSVEFHSVTEFMSPKESSGLPYKIKRIYSYGVMSCERSKLMLLVELYVDEQGVIRYTQSYEPGTHIVDMTGKNVRGDIRNIVCGDTI